MAKARTKKQAARKRPDPVTVAAALERARLKRMVQAKRDIARLVNELRRASDRSYNITLAWAQDIAEARGYELRPRKAGGATDEQMDSLAGQERRLDDEISRDGVYPGKAGQ
jgi:pyruvate-formate lyase